GAGRLLHGGAVRPGDRPGRRLPALGRQLPVAGGPTSRGRWLHRRLVQCGGHRRPPATAAHLPHRDRAGAAGRASPRHRPGHARHRWQRLQPVREPVAHLREPAIDRPERSAVHRAPAPRRSTPGEAGRRHRTTTRQRPTRHRGRFAQGSRGARRLSADRPSHGLLPAAAATGRGRLRHCGPRRTLVADGHAPGRAQPRRRLRGHVRRLPRTRRLREGPVGERPVHRPATSPCLPPLRRRHARGGHPDRHQAAAAPL
ncbi:MAG: lipolytic enzyme, G-D-S-L family, partial [uncultured Nocardioidaceae bacterium]